jgi:uncharacterized circularly permuted ATP-grasp superfamily protein
MSEPFDEALGPARDTYTQVFDRIAELGVAELAERVAASAAATGVEFGGSSDPRPFHVDPVPRLFTAAEWDVLEAGLIQRVLALDAFVADVYAERAIVEAGVVPARVIDSCDHYDPRVAELPAPSVQIGMAGLDLARGSDGVMRVLEDNLRTPSGMAYMSAARDSVAPAFPDLGRRPLDEALPRLPGECVVLLSDGPANTAWYEHQRLAAGLGIPLVTLADLEIASGRLRANGQPVDTVYRRTDEDRLSDEHGRLTEVGAALYEPLRAGTLTCVNGFGTGVADDKLVHAYVDGMVRFYLREEPLLPSVHTYDLADPACLQEVLGRLDELVIKPRTGHGGQGVVVGPHAKVADLRDLAHAIRRDPHDYIAQDTIMLSSHPTVTDGRLEPRHVDLRPFVFVEPGGAAVARGGLTRVALDRGTLVVNSSQRGGGKDTWVLW